VWRGWHLGGERSSSGWNGLGMELAGLVATLFAATYPERTRALVLFHPAVAGTGTESREIQEELSDLRGRWGTRELSDEILQLLSPTLYRDEAYRRRHADALRTGASPASAYALNRAYAESDLSVASSWKKIFRAAGSRSIRRSL
jgi:pimeloyl-ACP methyl ester carboxylesterase